MEQAGSRYPQAALVLTGVVALLAVPKLLRFWAGDPIFSLGFLVAPWVVWWILRLEPRVPSRTEVRLAAFAVTLLLAVAAWHFRSTWMALWALVAGLALVSAEKGRLDGAALPLVLLAVMAPPPFFDTVLNGAQLAVAWSAGITLATFGVPITWDGFILTTASYTFIVEPLCSGMSGLFSTAALVGIVGTHLAPDRRRILLALGIGLLATWLLNLLRVILLVAVTEHSGPNLIESAFHDGVSLVMSIGVALALLPLLMARGTVQQAEAEVTA